ncbi:DNA methyltransferase [Candidatus Synechococcus spongiarum]|uniref:site-specific DNA-methyltransferase (adenine-specific) n=1 Tax=Candidatus Synechococcus spongiarum TaxID=431041 RepID=A0A171DER4_9SYNE|nr:DNA methyltransferase [Candidatus Synechococcus spongiarum]SAY38324.1 FIG045374: Type II restriction enzyme, methylase subunit YeeA [Candidatus Synechococcus spongiarum]
MRLSWNEVRARAAAFADEWQDAVYEKGETQSFYNDFFQVFGVKRRTVARYEAHVAKLDNRSGFIDLFWPGVLIVEQKSAGRDLAAAYDQAGEYCDALPERERPRYILVSDFQTFQLYDLDERDTVAFTLVDLPGHVEIFGFILGVQRRSFRDQDPVNIVAAELVGLLHNQLAEVGHGGHDLEQFLVRVVFCLFADDTGVFEPRDIFVELMETRTSEDGADLGPWLAQLFQVLDTPEQQRPTTLDEDLARFPYINGDLFKGPLSMFSCNAAMRSALLDACRFDWSQVSPAIFGALFQSVMEPVQRRAQGAHYTTEKNILKVIEPLFMEDLRAEFARLQARKTHRQTALWSFQTRLGGLTFFDPACGCGNFLIIAYRELRLLEIDVLKALYPRDRDGRRQLEGWAADLSKLNVDQFYGIELGEFPARIAETALWMMDHIMNNQLSLEFGQTFVRIPLETSPNIVHDDALELDWAEVLAPEQCSYLFGNPPFVGAKYQTSQQRQQVRRIAGLGKSGGTLDYVAAWFLKAGEYLQRSTAPMAFVATNSITQGEQVGQLWPLVFHRCKLDIAFAHRTFAWGSDARGKAHVHVVILGLHHRHQPWPHKRLFSYPDINSEPEESRHQVLSPYLFDAGGLSDPHLVVQEESAPINGMSRLIIGSKPIDGGNYIFDAAERGAFLETEPEAAPWLRPFIGAREYLQGGERWILALHDTPPDVLARLPRVRERIVAVRAYREASKSKPTQKLAATPTLYHINVIPTAPFLLVPRVSSERRDYAPIGWLNPPVIPSDATLLLQNATLADFALLTSAMHMAWLRHIGGRLESSYRYSIGLVYNTFPLPPRDAGLSKLDLLAQGVLDARAAHPGATLADLYDPDTMPPNLRRAHQALDRGVDRLYRRSGFASERERVEYLLMMYEGVRAPLEAQARRKRKRVRFSGQ